MESEAGVQMGWIGTMITLKYALETFGADRDEQGRFPIQGEPPVTFMGCSGDDAELVVSAKTLCLIRGHPVSVAALLGSTSYGHKVHVII